ncbi:hypothetical protein NQ314_009559 [Rhamnusium bicolor]|uniref:Uncharacterized protein n=1 Tax=Rhamnusium bicolor TaxID=1586634 RepID=A0AAV8Y1K6_9CUCU|nr:hypothetical protein NQ314_009559 [Rhamnusium bicolor]
MTFGLACCAVEMMQFAAPRYDMDRHNGPGPSKRVRYKDKDYGGKLPKWIKKAEETNSSECDKESNADFVLSDYDTESEGK